MEPKGISTAQLLPIQALLPAQGLLIGPQEHPHQVPAGLFILDAIAAGGLLPPGGMGVVHLHVRAAPDPLDAVTAAGGLQTQLGLAEVIPCTHRSSSVSLP